MTIASSLRRIKGRTRWYARVCWNWLTFRRGTRPRRIARRWALRSAQDTPAGPALRLPAHGLIRQTPLIERYVQLLVNPLSLPIELSRREREVKALLDAAMAKRAAKSR